MLMLFTFEFEFFWEALNVLANLAGLSVRTADLADADDRRRIDAFVAAHPECGPFHRTEWTAGVEAGTGHRAYYLLAEKDGETAGVLPLSLIRSPIFGKALVSTGFGVGGGIVARSGETVEALAEAAAALAGREGCRSIELRGGPVPPGWQEESGVYAGFVRELPGDEAAILKSVPRKQRAEIRRAMKLGLQVRVGRDPKLFDMHYRIYGESVRNLGTPVFPPSLFRAMADAFGEDSVVLAVLAEGRPVAAVLSFYDRGTIYPYWGGGTREARRLRANELMYYALMCEAAKRGCSRFDFGRSKVGTGAYAFKKNWGFAPEPIVHAVRGSGRNLNPLSPRHRLATKVWKRLPLGIANRLGPPIARGLG